MKPITAVIPFLSKASTSEAVKLLDTSRLIEKIFTYSGSSQDSNSKTDFNVKNILSSSAIKQIARSVKTEYLLFQFQHLEVHLEKFSLERMLLAASQSGASMVYSNYLVLKDGITQEHPTIDYQIGSIRDDFDFGPIVLINSKLLLNTA